MKEEEWIARWVARLNRLAAEMDALAASLHPSAWDEQLAGLRAEYRALAAQHYPAGPYQPSLFESEEPV